MNFKELIICHLCNKQVKDLVICLNCKCSVCKKCFNHFHKESKKLNHQQISINEVIEKNKNFQIYLFCKEIQIINFYQYTLELKILRQQIFDFVVLNAQKGKCMVSFSKIWKNFKKHQKNIKKNLIYAQIKEDIKNGVYIEIKRSFGTKKFEQLIALKIHTVSIQLISFILRSIYLHKMEPNYILIHSRLKEFFGIKLKMKDWKKFVENLYCKIHLQNKIKNIAHLLEGFKIVPNTSGNYIFQPFDYKWEFQDTISISDQDPDYQIYLQCMDHFFQRENNEDFQFITLNPSYWNICQETEEKQKNSLIDLLKQQNIDKAIPGGKYGCALMLKNLYSKKLKKIKIGKIISMIKKSLKEQKFIYDKTLIYQNKQLKLLNEDQRDQILQKIKQVIITVLEEKKEEGLSLPQLPQILYENLLFQPNFNELGFPKLKHFIETMQNISIQKNNENHISIKLKKYTTWQEELNPNLSKKKSKHSDKSKHSKFSYFNKNQQKQVHQKNLQIQHLNLDLNFSDENDSKEHKNYVLGDKKLLNTKYIKLQENLLSSQNEIEQNIYFKKYLKKVLKKLKKPLPLNALKFQMQQLFQKNQIPFVFSDKQFIQKLQNLDGKVIDIIEENLTGEYSDSQKLISLKKQNSRITCIKKNSISYSTQNCQKKSYSIKQTNQSSNEFHLWSGNSTPENDLHQKPFKYFSDKEKQEKILTPDSSFQIQTQITKQRGFEGISEKNIQEQKFKSQKLVKGNIFKFKGNKERSFPNFPTVKQFQKNYKFFQ